MRTTEVLKRHYWRLRETIPLWLRQHRPDAMRRRAALRWRAWRRPVVEIGGVRLWRSPQFDIPVLQALEAEDYEGPEARIIRHALAPGDVVLELGTGLGFISVLCARSIGGERVHTYEANPALERLIRRNHGLNGVAPRLEICMLGEAPGETTFYLMKSFWSSSTVRRHPRARPIRVPVKSFNAELARIRPSFLIIDIEGGEAELVRHARLEGVAKVCIELHPHVIGEAAVQDVVDFFTAQGFCEVGAVSDDAHKLFVRTAGAAGADA